MASLAMKTAEVTNMSSVDANAFRNGMRRLAGAVCVLTLRKGELRAGLTATAVVSVSAEPARLMVCINRNVFAHRLLEVGASLCVNVLAQGNLQVAHSFAGMLEGVDGEKRFEHGRWVDGASEDAPYLADAMVAFQCQVVELIDASSHSMVLCEVRQVQLPVDAEQDPLLYFGGRFATLDNRI
ncbi:flavin reductase family protein [Pseudomonas sp. s4]|uniref:flavin reductase family protein n=1 Tax=Pseudomonas sp. s4 TaxID=353218 RepID=UPI00398C944C